jgi:hypothetical protein
MIASHRSVKMRVVHALEFGLDIDGDTEVKVCGGLGGFERES